MCPECVPVSVLDAPKARRVDLAPGAPETPGCCLSYTTKKEAAEPYA